MNAAYPVWTMIDTRWSDADVYGHVNNVVYYGLFDTAVNRWLIEGGVLDPARSDCFGLVVETGCTYRKPLHFPDRVAAGLRVAKLGTRSVAYEIALHKVDDPEPAAEGRFVHVYVDRATRRPVPIPDAVRRWLQAAQA